MKKRIIVMAEELGVDVEVLFKIRNERLDKAHWTGTGKNTYFTEEGQERIKLALEAPLAVPAVVQAMVLQEARNPRWVFAMIEGQKNKVPVAIPRKLKGVLVGKVIPVQVIEDATGGVTYRHASLAN